GRVTAAGEGGADSVAAVRDAMAV
ncbi:MAG: hypothetical protein QOC60_400, partial [Frankiaceae bacterium]|nr:hypothetical protein [Frankiaceae bacterium]MDQ1714455.1 hypothetical protein [Frankiaceae bacterium]